MWLGWEIAGAHGSSVTQEGAEGLWGVTIEDDKDSVRGGEAHFLHEVLKAKGAAEAGVDEDVADGLRLVEESV